MVYSAHAIIVISGKYLLNKEHEEFGFLFPGGRFEDYYIKRAGTEGWCKISREVLERELKEELNPTKIEIKYLIEILSDEIATKNGKVYSVNQMWFYSARIEPNSLSELEKRVSIPLRLMSREEIEKEVISNAMKKILKKLPPYYP